MVVTFKRHPSILQEKILEHAIFAQCRAILECEKLETTIGEGALFFVQPEEHSYWLKRVNMTGRKFGKQHVIGTVCFLSFLDEAVANIPHKGKERLNKWETEILC